MLPVVEAESLIPGPPGLSQLSSSLKRDALWRERPAPPTVALSPVSAPAGVRTTWQGCTGRVGRPGPCKPAPALLTGPRPHPAPQAPRFPAPAQEPPALASASWRPSSGVPSPLTAPVMLRRPRGPQACPRAVALTQGCSEVLARKGCASEWLSSHLSSVGLPPAAPAPASFPERSPVAWQPL